MQKIVTLTLNPAIDKSTTVGSIVPDKKLRCTQPVFEPGGGGVNVSRALKRLGTDSTAVYLAGGHSGKYFEHLLHAEQVESHVVEIEGHTRENMIVVDTSSSLQYRFGMPGPYISEQEWQKCLDVFEQLSGVEYIVSSGSMSPGIPEDFNGRLSALAKKIGARLIVDTSGEALKHAITEGVFMIKPNLGELSNLYGVEELHGADIEAAAKEIIRKGGCEVMVISMGPSGAMLVTKDDCFESPSPKVKRKSTVGAGDSMVAGMVYGLHNKMDWEAVLQMGIATGTATTLNPGTELCKKEDVDGLFAFLQSRTFRTL